jgi:carbohydrate-selective porin OprB
MAPEHPGADHGTNMMIKMKHPSPQNRWALSISRDFAALTLLGMFLAGTSDPGLAADTAPATATNQNRQSQSSTPTTSTNEIAPRGFWDWFIHTDRLTGEWGGLRPKLEDKGLRFTAFANYFWAMKNDGGADQQRDNRNSESVDFYGQADFGKMGLIPGGEALIQVKHNYGRNINPGMGALSDPIDDADGYPLTDAGGHFDIYIDQLWYQQSLFAKKLQVRLGYLDQQTILDRNAYANNEDTMFMSTYLDNNNAIIPLTIGPAVSLFYNPADWLSFVLGSANAESKVPHGSFDTVFDDDWEFNCYFETGLKYKLKTTYGPLPGNFRAGALLDAIDKPTFDSTDVKTETYGAYLSWDQLIYAESEKDKQGLGLFGRFGWRPANVNKIQYFWSAGAQYQGLIPSRDNDVLGFGVYSAILSEDLEDINPDADRETGYELYYRLQLTPAIAFSPGFQYISQPGGLESRKDAMVFALRTRLSF